MSETATEFAVELYHGTRNSIAWFVIRPVIIFRIFKDITSANAYQPANLRGEILPCFRLREAHPEQRL